VQRTEGESAILIDKAAGGAANRIGRAKPKEAAHRQQYYVLSRCSGEVGFLLLDQSPTYDTLLEREVLSALGREFS
jgi:hypothetical protein